MKHSTIVIILIFSSLAMNAQKDVIYPEIGKTGIRNCTITNVTGGNKVQYIKDSISGVIDAVAIRRDGKYITLDSESIDVYYDQSAVYKGKSYDYYSKQHRSAIRTRNAGIGLTLCGLGAGIIGGFTLANGVYNTTTKRVFTTLYIGGGILTNLGIILWVSEGSHAANINRAMKKAKNNANLSLGLTNNGFGFLLTFNK